MLCKVHSLQLLVARAQLKICASLKKKKTQKFKVRDCIRPVKGDLFLLFVSVMSACYIVLNQTCERVQNNLPKYLECAVVFLCFYFNAEIFLPV